MSRCESFRSGSTFEAAAGYVRARRQGNLVFTSGTTGFNYSTMAISDDMSMQVRQAIENTRAALAALGVGLSNVVQCNWVITDPKYFEEVGKILKVEFGGADVVMMTLVCGLVDPRMKFEIQVIAVDGN